MYFFFRLLSCLLIMYGTAYAEEIKSSPKATSKETESFSKASTKETKPSAKKKLKALPEIVLGKKNAPILIIDYSSLTCTHCAEFFLKIVPKLQEKYVNPGYVRVVFRDCPTDQISLKAHQVAWSKGEMRYLDFVKLLYSTQEKWLLAKDPIAELKKIVADKGISNKQFDEALKDQDLLDKIIQARLEGQKKYKLTATPTLIINTKVYPEALTMKEVVEILDPLIKPLVDKKTKSSETKDSASKK